MIKKGERAMAGIGRWNNLKVVKEKDFGLYLDGESLGEILLPRKYVPREWKEEERLKVFLYLDSEDRLIATTRKPYAQVGEFAFLKVISTSPIGAFLDWGLEKDLLVPFNEQKRRMEWGRSYVVFLYIDEKSGRIAASSKINKFLEKGTGPYGEGESVDLFVWEKTELGFKAIINENYEGLLFHSEIFTPLKTGDRVKGFIKKIRSDGRIDLVLQKGREGGEEEAGRKILEKLEEEEFIAVTNKSSAEEIYNLFGVSKKAYKKTVSRLYEKGLIVLEEGGIRKP